MPLFLFLADYVEYFYLDVIENIFDPSYTEKVVSSKTDEKYDNDGIAIQQTKYFNIKKKQSEYSGTNGKYLVVYFYCDGDSFAKVSNLKETKENKLSTTEIAIIVVVIVVIVVGIIIGVIVWFLKRKKASQNNATPIENNNNVNVNNNNYNHNNYNNNYNNGYNNVNYDNNYNSAQLSNQQFNNAIAYNKVNQQYQQ